MADPDAEDVVDVHRLRRIAPTGMRVQIRSDDVWEATQYLAPDAFLELELSCVPMDELFRRCSTCGLWFHSSNRKRIYKFFERPLGYARSVCSLACVQPQVRVGSQRERERFFAALAECSVYGATK